MDVCFSFSVFMHYLRLSSVLFLFFISSFATPTVQALETMADEQVIIQEVKKDDLYMAGNIVKVEGEVEGDVIAAGNDITIQQRIAQDLTLVGRNLIVNAPVGDDVKVAGGFIEINQAVAGDLIVFGGSTIVGKDTVIIGDAVIFTGMLTLEGIIEGDLMLFSDTIVVGPNAKILGNVQYSASQKYPELEKIVQGQVEFDTSAMKTTSAPQPSPWEQLLWILDDIVQMILLTLFLFFFCRRLFQDSLQMLQQRPGKSYLLGLLFSLLGWAISIFLLIISVSLSIWWFVSWLTFFILLEQVFLSVFLVVYLIEKNNIRNTFSQIMTLMLATTAVELLWFVLDQTPLFGWIIQLAIFIALFAPLMGALFLTKTSLLRAYEKGEM